jgi:CubicO group peptidase (beta-lactamase class C family)
MLVRIVEEVSQMPYAEFIKKNIFDKLGMANTSYKLSDFDKKDIAISYKLIDGKLVGTSPENNFGDYPDGYTGGGAGLISTLDDYTTFAEAILESYVNDGGLIKKSSVELMKKPWLDKKIAGVSPTFNWGLGVRVVNMQTDWQRLTPGAFGWSGAYGSHFWIDVDKKIVAVYMHNSESFGGAGVQHTLDFERAVYEQFTKDL